MQLKRVRRGSRNPSSTKCDRYSYARVWLISLYWTFLNVKTAVDNRTIAVQKDANYNNYSILAGYSLREIISVTDFYE